MSRKVEVLVVGAGPAGIAAATAAANCGKRVVVLDDNRAAGGQIWRAGRKQHEGPRDKAKAIAAFERSGAELLSGRCVVDASQSHILRAVSALDGAERIERFEWERLILATGARERFLPFSGWTLPGVFGVGGLQALAKDGLSVAGKRIVVAGSGPLLLAVAAYLRAHGAKIVSIAEQAPFSQILPFALSLMQSPSKLMQGAQYRGALARVPYRFGCWPIAAIGGSSLQSVRLTDGKRTWIETCDYLACGFNLVPNSELAALLGCETNLGVVKVDALQQTTVDSVYCAGEPCGIAGLGAAVVQGKIAGLAAGGEERRATALYPLRDRERAFGERLNQAFRLRGEVSQLAARDTIVCRCEDVSFSKLEKHNSWTDAKLQTRCGMGPCQGRICGAAVETLFGWNPSSVRPPIFPISIAALSDETDIHNTENKVLQEIP